MKKLISVVGARPNFMKVAPIHKAFNRLSFDSNISHLICHTGQHYDEKMSKVFFDELDMPKPDFYLEVGSGSHAEQTAKIMIEFEKVLIKEQPDLVIVVGDVNSTIACSLTAVKLGIKVAHVEAGLRSFDRTMPEEINRILTDSISDYLFVTEKSGLENLRKEGISGDKVFLVGNVMIDTLLSFMPKIEKSNIAKELNIFTNYVLVTLHRPSNVDRKENLKNLVEFFNRIADDNKIVFPIHPRTRKNLDLFNLTSLLNPNILLTEPIGYLDFLSLVKNSSVVLTDSGGIQEETTVLGIPCITLRNSTERPITVEIGSNYLVGDNLTLAFEKTKEILNGMQKSSKIPDLWDGKAAERIVDIIMKKLSN